MPIDRSVTRLRRALFASETMTPKLVLVVAVLCFAVLVVFDVKHGSDALLTREDLSWDP